MVKQPLLTGAWIGGGWVEGYRFLSYTMKLGRDFITWRIAGINHAANI